MNMRLIIFAVPSLLLLATVSCSSTSSDSANVPVEVGDERIVIELMESLKDTGINYVRVDNDSILVAPEDAERVINTLNGITEQYIPPHRNAEFPEDDLPGVLAALNENNVNYEVVEVFGGKWIVWAPGEDAAIKHVFSNLPPSQMKP